MFNLKEIIVEKGLALILLLILLFAVLIPSFIWINNHYNDPEGD